MHVSRGQLTKACETGCASIEQLVTATQASTVCGSCRPLLAEMIGRPETAGGVAGWRLLGLISAVTAAAIGTALYLGSWQFASSFQSPAFAWDQLLLNDLFKQVTGFTLVGLSLIAAGLSVRKRWNKFSFGTYGLWRVFHASIGLLCLVGLIAHTGFRFGANLNAVLMTVFLGTITIGALTGAIASYESKSGNPPPMWVKRWRPYLTWAHVLFTWPLPVLITFHALAYYMSAE